jgi:hypothetical protein
MIAWNAKNLLKITSVKFVKSPVILFAIAPQGMRLVILAAASPRRVMFVALVEAVNTTLTTALL